MRTTNFCIVTILALTQLVLVGCNQSAKTNCASIMQALNLVSSYHLHASENLDVQKFNQAQLALLERYQLNDSPSSTSLSTLYQCQSTIEKITKANPLKTADSLGLELLDIYVRQWDPHSGVVKDQERYDESDARTDFGFSWQRLGANQNFEILEVFPSSAAFAAGIQEHSWISAINNIPANQILINNPFQDSEALDLQIRSDSQAKPIEVHLVKSTYQTSPFRFDTFDQVAYLKLRKLAVGSQILAEVLRSFHKSKVLLLDLRDLSGGDLKDAAQIASLFINGPKAFVGFLGRNQVMKDSLLITPKKTMWTKPLVLLVNSNTKSAAEALAAALQDYGGLVIGEKTFGKGTRQINKRLKNYELSDTLAITDAYLIRPSGEALQLDGVTPDFEYKTTQTKFREKNYNLALAAPKLPSGCPCPLEGYLATSLNVSSTLAALGSTKEFFELLTEQLELKPKTISDEELIFWMGKEVAAKLVSLEQLAQKSACSSNETK